MTTIVRLLPSGSLDVVDPWGDRAEIMAHADVQFTKTDAVLSAQGVAPARTDRAKRSCGGDVDADPQ